MVLPGDSVSSNPQPNINWRVFNIPSLTAIATLTIAIFVAYGNQARELERMEVRLDNIEVSKAKLWADNGLKWDRNDIIITQIAAQSNKNEYRISSVEQQIIALDTRENRDIDTMEALRDRVEKIATSMEVLSQKLNTLVPFRKGELDSIPPELIKPVKDN